MLLEAGLHKHRECKGTDCGDPWSPPGAPGWAPQVTAGEQTAPLVMLGPTDPMSSRILQGYGQQSRETHYAGKSLLGLYKTYYGMFRGRTMRDHGGLQRNEHGEGISAGKLGQKGPFMCKEGWLVHLTDMTVPDQCSLPCLLIKPHF